MHFIIEVNLNVKIIMLIEEEVKKVQVIIFMTLGIIVMQRGNIYHGLKELVLNVKKDIEILNVHYLNRRHALVEEML